MHIGNFFGRESKEEILEILLREAVEDPGKRSEFYRKLLNHELYVIGSTNRELKDLSDGSVETDDTLKLAQYNINDKNQIPVFTSLSRLKECIQEEVSFIQLNAKDLLKSIPKGCQLVLNPYSEYGKEFTWKEIQSILNGSIFKINNNHAIYSVKNRIFLAPENVSDAFIDSLSSYFRSHTYIKQAYLVEVLDPARKDQTQYILGIRIQKSSGHPFEDAEKELGYLAGETLRASESVAFVNMEQGGKVSNDLEDTTGPFFEAA